MTKTYPEAVSMKKGDKSADWFVKKFKKGKPDKLEKAMSKTFLELLPIVYAQLIILKHDFNL